LSEPNSEKTPKVQNLQAFDVYQKLQLLLTETYSEECKNVGTG